MASTFNFNNCATFSKTSDNNMQSQFFTYAAESYEQLITMMKVTHSTPVSLRLTQEVLNNRKIIEKESLKAKFQTQLYTTRIAEVLGSIAEAKSKAHIINSSHDYKKPEYYSGFKKSDTRGDVTQCTVCSGEKGMCNVSQILGIEMRLRPCFDERGNCTECSKKCHYSFHENTNQVYVKATLCEEIAINSLRYQLGPTVQGLSNTSILIYKYIGDLINFVREMEQSQMKIRECDAFLQENAARKKAYVSTDYFRE